MIAFFLHWIISACLLLVIAKIFDGVSVSSWTSAFIGALVLALVNALIRPIALVITFPLTILTLGLFLFVLNALMLKFAAFLVPGFKVKGLGTALLASMLLSVFGMMITTIY